MNIIKFNNELVPDQEWYNKNLRGKYAYWVRCRYVVPLTVGPNQYVCFESSINDLLGYDYYILTESDGSYQYNFIDINEITLNQKQNAVLVEEVPEYPDEDSPEFIKIDNSTISYIDLWDDNNEWITEHIDLTETDKSNDAFWYVKYNDYVSGTISIDDLKKFRTWFAQSLLGVKSTWVEDESHMLNYYVNGMYDDSLKWISICAKKTIEEIKITGSNCGCTNGTDLSSLYNGSLRVCDPESIYKEGIKNIMISTYSNLELWKTLPTSFVNVVKSYIDGIIDKNFPFESFTDDAYASCDCLNNTSSQTVAIEILKNLSKSLNYIITDSIDGHKNYISTTLTNWSTKLYELMQWN